MSKVQITVEYRFVKENYLYVWNKFNLDGWTAESTTDPV